MKWWILLVGALVSSCASPKLIDTGRVGIYEADALPPPTDADLAGAVRDSRLGPLDKIGVEVTGLTELSREVVVDAGGQISLPVAGRIDVAGKSPGEVAAIIEARLRAGAVRNPQVGVNLIEAVSEVVTVEGAVRRPGNYPVIGKLTMMRAIARAEGTSDIADTNHVVVLRSVGGKQMAALYDLRAIRLGAYPDPVLYPNDVVTVGESGASKLFPQILQAGSLILTPLLYVLR